MTGEPGQPPAARRMLRPAAWLAFFLSGASSLVFQTLWSRQLSHVFGSSSLAVSSVVSVFMAGLGLGAFLFGRRADRIRDPLRVYAIAEFLIGCIALVVPWLVRSDGWLAHVNAGLRALFGPSSFAFVLARFLCIVPILILPTVLMGSTLPLLARHFVAQQSSPALASREVGRLYAINTLGAVIGVAGCTFVLLPSFGVATANAVAASTNFALALLILGLRRADSRARIAATVRLGDARDVPPAPAAPDASQRAAFWAFACSGFASLLYEVVWSRALVNTIGGSLYSFALILSTFLVGIAGGSALAAALAERERRRLPLAAVSAAALSLVAAGPRFVQGGAPAFGIALGTAWLSVAVGSLVGRRVLRRQAWLEDDDSATACEEDRDRRLALLVLVAPVCLAAFAVFARSDRLAWITFAVVTSSVALLVVLITLARSPFLLVVGLQLYIALATLVSDVFADSLSLAFASMVAPLHHALPEHVHTVQALMFFTAALCVLPSALAMGAVFPAALRVWTRGGRQIGKDVGVLYTGNTLGSIAGAWLPGFVLMPLLGMQATLHVGMAVNLLVAFSLALVALRGRQARADVVQPAPLEHRRAGLSWFTIVVTPGALAALALFTLRPEYGLGWNISKMTLGAFRISLARDVLDEESWGAPDLVYYRDGLSTTVTVERWGRHYSLKNNGKVDASNGDDMPTQIMVAALPLLFHPGGPDGRDLAIIGFGSGVTVGAALSFPVRSVEVIELERATVEASRFFAEVNHLQYTSDRFPYVQEPRLRVVADDGRNYLAATRERYDVIVSEPSNPWLTGVSDLFTLDHFRIAKQKLAPGGIYCQWVQLYELSPQNVQIIYRTFAELFRHVVVFSAESLSSDTILIGSDSPLPLDRARVARALGSPLVVRELERADIHSPEDVLARTLLASREELSRFTAGSPLNTDDNARIELSAPRDLIGFEAYKGYLETMYARDWPYARIVARLTGFGSGPQATEHYARLASALLAHGRKQELPELLARAGAELGSGAASSESGELEIARELYRLLSTTDGEPVFSSELSTPSDANAQLRTLIDETRASALEALAAGQRATALRRLDRIPAQLRHKLGSDWALFEGYLNYKAGDPERCVELLEELLRSDETFGPRRPELYYFLARSHDALMHFDDAVRNMRAFVALRMSQDAPPSHTAVTPF